MRYFLLIFVIFLLWGICLPNGNLKCRTVRPLHKNWFVKPYPRLIIQINNVIKTAMPYYLKWSMASDSFSYIFFIPRPFIDFALFHEEFCFLLLFFTATWSLKKFQTTKHKHLEHSVMVDVFHSKVFVRCANRKTVLFEIIFNKNQAYS